MLGILSLNLLFCLVGLALLWGLRGFGSLLDLLELLGLALMLGLGAVSVLATLVLVAGGGLGAPTILGLMLAVGAAGAGLALARRRRLPRTLGSLPALNVGMIAAAAGAIATLAVLVALFRLARVTPLQGADSWEFWVPKAKLIYFNGGIGGPFFRSLAEGNIPLLVPALLAMDFRFMGSANAPELAIQYWFIYAGFVFAAAALLRRLAPAWLVWLFLGLSAVIPELDQRVIDAQGDWTVDILFALAALLCVAWLRSRERWLLGGFGIVLAALLATKPESMLIAACFGLGVAAGTIRSWRRVWPVLLAVGAGAYAVNVPWRLWWESRHLQTDFPGGASVLVSHAARIWPSLERVLRLRFSPPMWLLTVPLALLAAVACVTLAGRVREAAVAYLATFVLALAGFTWFALTNDIVSEAQSASLLPRLVGSMVLFSTVLAPVLVAPLPAPPRTRRGSFAAVDGIGPVAGPDLVWLIVVLLADAGGAEGVAYAAGGHGCFVHACSDCVVERVCDRTDCRAGAGLARAE